jgi:hypothetical protein
MTNDIDPRTLDYEALAESLTNGNRSHVAAELSLTSNPAWALLRLGRQLVSHGDEPLDVIVNLQGLIEDRWSR